MLSIVHALKHRNKAHRGTGEPRVLRVVYKSPKREIFESIGLGGVLKRLHRDRVGETTAPHRNLELNLCFGDIPRLCPLMSTSQPHSATQQNAAKEGN